MMKVKHFILNVRGINWSSRYLKERHFGHENKLLIKSWKHSLSREKVKFKTEIGKYEREKVYYKTGD